MSHDATLAVLWAKTAPFHPLPCHLIDVGNTALSLLSTAPFRGTISRFGAATGCPIEAVPSWMAYLAALHDIGKCHADFQGIAPDLTAPLRAEGLPFRKQPEKFRHDAYSAEWLKLRLTSDGWSKAEACTVSEAIGGHHGSFDHEQQPYETPGFQVKWEPLRGALRQTVWEVFAPPPWQPQFLDHSIAGLLLAGLLVLSDWIASNRELFLPPDHRLAPDRYAPLSRNAADAAVQQLGLGTDLPWTPGQSFHDIWPDIEQPRPVQQRCEQLCREGISPGLCIIEAPMGEGKTEAAIYIATQWLAQGGSGGIYFALPTAATSNQMFTRTQAFLKQHDPRAAEGVRLVHGTSWMVDAKTPEHAPELSDDSAPAQALDWFRPKKRSLLATYGVGTIDQALMSALNVKHGFLRLYGLAGKVLIIDEVHAYDAYMLEILTRLLRWCGALAVPVLLLSATLPQERRQDLLRAYHPEAVLRPLGAGELAPYPLLTLVDHQGTVREEAGIKPAKASIVKLILERGLLGDPVGVARLVAQASEVGGCFCVIANTVGSAQRIYRKLKATLEAQGRSDTLLLLLHARFRAERRRNIEQRTLDLFDNRSLLEPSDPKRTERPASAILVATQVVEQSLDLDFDELFTEIAPIDLILQRTGRLHRHDRAERPTGRQARLHILLPPEGDSAFPGCEQVYDRYILLKTLEVLDEEFQLPEVIRPLIAAVYDQPAETISDRELAETWATRQKKLIGDGKEAKRYLIPVPYKGAFKLARSGDAFDEEDAGAVTYFTARTRQGDETRTVLVLEGDAYASELAGRHPPKRETLKALYLKTVAIPTWWLKGVTPAPAAAPEWMPGAAVLRMSGGRWQGRDAKDKPFSIRDDDLFGLTRDDGGV